MALYLTYEKFVEKYPAIRFFKRGGCSMIGECNGKIIKKQYLGHGMCYLGLITRELTIYNRFKHPFIHSLIHWTYKFEETKFYDELTGVSRMSDISCYMVFDKGEPIEKLGDFPSEVLEKIYQNIVCALKFLHRKGYLHGDVKYTNIIYHEDVFKLIDFGWSIKFDSRKNMPVQLYQHRLESCPGKYIDIEYETYRLQTMLQDILHRQIEPYGPLETVDGDDAYCDPVIDYQVLQCRTGNKRLYLFIWLATICWNYKFTLYEYILTVHIIHRLKTFLIVNDIDKNLIFACALAVASGSITDTFVERMCHHTYTLEEIRTTIFEIIKYLNGIIVTETSYESINSIEDAGTLFFETFHQYYYPRKKMITHSIPSDLFVYGYDDEYICKISLDDMAHLESKGEFSTSSLIYFKKNVTEKMIKKILKQNGC